MQARFYVSHDQNQLGPFSIKEIGHMLQAKELLPTDYIYLEDKEDWISIMEFKELANYIKPGRPKKTPPKNITKEDKTQVHSMDSNSDKTKEEWFVLKGEKKFGPFSYLEVVKMLQEKSVFEFDYIWKKNMKEWQRVAELSCFQVEAINSLKSLDDQKIQQIFFRRRHARASFGSSLIIHDNSKVWKGESMEISEGGCGLKMWNSSLLPGQKVFIHFKPAGELPPFNAVCEIVNKKYEDGVKTQNAPILYGVKFLSIEAAARKAVRKYTEDKYEKAA